MHLRDLSSLFRTCQSLREAATTIHVHRVHTLLRYYVPNPSEFRGFMREQGIIISGSPVLWLIEGFPSIWQPSKADLYVPYGNASAVIKYLILIGYEEQAFFNDFPLESLFASYLYSTTMLRNAEGQHIVVLESLDSNASMPITRLTTTLMMNYLEADFMVLLYPATTCARVGVIAGDREPENEWITRYRGRGYTICRQMYYVPSWMLHAPRVFPTWLWREKHLVLPLTYDPESRPRYWLMWIDFVYHDYCFPPHWHRHCASCECNLSENQKIGLAIMHSVHSYHSSG